MLTETMTDFEDAEASTHTSLGRSPQWGQGQSPAGVQDEAPLSPKIETLLHTWQSILIAIFHTKVIHMQKSQPVCYIYRRWWGAPPHLSPLSTHVCKSRLADSSLFMVQYRMVLL